MIFEVVLLGEDRLPLVRRRPVKGSSLDPSFITELLGRIEREAKLTMGNEIWSGYELGKYFLLVHHDGDDAGVSIVREIVVRNIEEPEKILDALRLNLLPLVEEVELLLEIMPKEEFDLRKKRPSMLKKLAKTFSRKGVYESLLGGDFESAIYAKPKDDVERALRIMAATHAHFMPPRIPAPDRSEIEKVLEEISDPLLKEISNELLARVQTGLSTNILRVVKEHKEELIQRLEHDKRIAMLLIGPTLTDPELFFIVDIARELSSYRGSIADAYKTIIELLSAYKPEMAISVLGTFKNSYESPEEAFMDVAKTTTALEVLIYAPYDDPEKIFSRLSEEALRALEIALGALDKKPAIFCSLLVSVPLSLSYVIATLGLYAYHTGKQEYKAYFIKLKDALKKVSESVFEFLKYARISGIAAMVSLANLMPIERLVEEMLGEELKEIRRLPRRIARYISEAIGDTLKSIYEENKPAYAAISTSFIGSVISSLEELPSEYFDLVAKVSKNAIERVLVSGYSEDKSLAMMLGLTIPRVWSHIGAGETVVEEGLKVLKERLEGSLSRLVVSAEAARILEQGGRRELAKKACELVEKSIVCEGL